jgi:hypothetical protein
MKTIPVVKRARTGLSGLLTIACVVLLSTQLRAQDEIRTERVAFKKGEAAAKVESSIRGRETVDYVLGARAGQAMIVELSSKNPGAYFNVMAAGADTALFIGSIYGSRFEGTLPNDGDYIVRVYLVRSAARRQETASYTLDVKISGGALPDTLADYDASGSIKCSVDAPSLEGSCDFRVKRSATGAEIWIAHGAGDPGAPSRIIYAYGTQQRPDSVTFAASGGEDVTWERRDDNWLVEVGHGEFYFIPDALIFGG